MNWYIGQRIVAIRNHRGFKKGDEFNIKGIRRGPCGCGCIEFDIGINDDDRVGSGLWQAICTSCGGRGKVSSDSTWWFRSVHFAPLDEWQQAEKAVKELLEPQKIKI